MSESLNSTMSFDRVIRIEDGEVITFIPDDREYWPPDVHWADGLEFDDDEWSLMEGYTGQYGYSGPVMHGSEYIGGRMEDDIKAKDGFYVAIVVNDILTDENEDDYDVTVGWVVAYREAVPPNADNLKEGYAV